MTMSEAITRDEMIEKGLNRFISRMDKAGITEEFLIKELKRKIKQKIPKEMKLKGAIDPSNLAKGFRVVAISGTLAYDKEGNQVFGDGETVIQWKEDAAEVQQAARVDAQKLRNLYPKPGIDVDLSATGILAEVLKEIDGTTRGLPSMDKTEVQGEDDD